MALRDILRARLGLRIYLVGLAQFAVIAVGFYALLQANRPPGGGPRAGHVRYVAGVVEPLLGDPRAVERELLRARRELHASFTVVDPDGAVVATAARHREPRCAPESSGRPPDRAGMVCHAAPLAFPDGRRGHLQTVAPERPPPVGMPVVALVLVVVGVSSWLLSRSLAQPLRRLSAAARAFGSGDRSARAEIDRRDELGDVSRSFDEMAERVTELLRAEKELLANVSHELRTPLSRIRVALDLAAEGDADMARESLTLIAEDLDELERLISDVLTAARLDLGDGSSPAGIPPLRRGAVDVRDLLAHAESRFRAAHPDRALCIEVADDLPAVDGDAVLLRRVVDNLLENAHKYSERAAEPVTLAARGDGAAREVVIEVIDRGIGIAAADLPRVFRPFFRADRSRTRATGGLGLGLALAKRIVDAHGGQIDLTSAPGEGTRARVRLPIAGAPEVHNR